MPYIDAKLKEKQVEIRADDRCYSVIKGYPYLQHATEEDYYTEYGGPIISIKMVKSLDEAIAHINEHSTHHSEAIITNNEEAAEKFSNSIDSSSVYVNASTRFTDGFVFGLGAEIGISTQKLHARGPMGLDALVTSKYFIKGNGAVRK
jgi:glutamate-5-semialdehyde dehydrogenase